MRGIATALMVLIGVLLAPATVRAQELDGGGWRGDWVDNNSGHVGPLRGRFRPTRDGNYRAVFTGTYRKVIPFIFAVKLNVVERDGDRVTLAGESRVMGFGRFAYGGVADAHHFNAHYDSGRWTGEFNLSR